MFRAVVATVAVLPLCVLSACSDGDGDDEPRPVTGAAKEVALVVEAFERATATREFTRVCSELFTPQVRRQAGGKDCPALLKRTAAEIDDPRIEIRKITVKRDRATAEVVTRARGQKAAEDRIELVRQGGRYRIAALAG